VGGVGADDTDLMRELPGWIAKRGAEGLFCAAGPDGEGVALKVEDGTSRALRPALGHILGIERFREVPVSNSRGEIVGALKIAPL
jgi:L-asparaginase II